MSNTTFPQVYPFVLKNRSIGLFSKMVHWAKCTIEIDVRDWQNSPYKNIVSELNSLKASVSTEVTTLNLELTRDTLLEVLKALAYTIWLFIERGRETHDDQGYSCAEYQALYFKLSKDYIGICKLPL